MYPILFSLGPVHIYSFGVFLALAFVAGSFYIWRESRNEFREEVILDALVVAVAHDQFKTLGIDGLRQLANGHAVIYDIKGLFPKKEVDGRL